MNSASGQHAASQSSDHSSGRYGCLGPAATILAPQRHGAASGISGPTPISRGLVRDHGRVRRPAPAIGFLLTLYYIVCLGGEAATMGAAEQYSSHREPTLQVPLVE